MKARLLDILWGISVVAIFLMARLLSFSDGIMSLGNGPALSRTCLFHIVTGYGCPGCGLTRSFVALMHGGFSASIAYHPFGVILAFLMLISLVLIVVSMVRCTTPMFNRPMFIRGFEVVAVLLVIVWIAGLCGYFTA